MSSGVDVGERVTAHHVKILRGKTRSCYVEKTITISVVSNAQEVLNGHIYIQFISLFGANRTFLIL